MIRIGVIGYGYWGPNLVRNFMEAGDCDVGLANHYYLGRVLEEDPDFPVAPAWPDQDGAGAHANVSGVGLVKSSDSRDDAIALMEYLTSPPAHEAIVERSEFAANPAVPPPEHIRDWANVKIDPIAVEEAGPLLDEAGVATIAGTSFGAFGENYIRFSYANSLEAITEAMERIRRFLGNLPQSDAAG